ncbi:MAG: F0F1 ATP synthase subunit epsilon [Gammaproteobacteria bacterium TMED119]|nr:MAG: F0F1 ATP synthase subunit epsilon [Gammaproteobacteria bacterium TMED119]RCL47069.1 MAG: F0F1 ATP synthase subunit epsilon [Candidatus Thioglobus sp.]|tara:strand:+ start:2004 stop:2420 length:417 start_codon:yes stop_codon:yes gene_type:complete
MATTMQLDIVSAEAEIFSGEVNAVIAPAIMGDVGIYPNHTPLVTQLKPGELKIEVDGQPDQHIYVSGGMLEVQPDIITVLSDTAVRAEDLDEAKALEAKQKAEEALAEKGAEIDSARAMAELAEANARLRMIQKIRKG